MALMKEISPIISGNIPPNFGKGKMETFLTCRALASYLKENALGNERGEFLEKTTLQAVYLAILAGLNVSDSQLLLSEIQNILPLDYPEVEEIRKLCLEIIVELKNTFKLMINDPNLIQLYCNINDYDNLLRLLKVFDYYNHK